MLTYPLFKTQSMPLSATSREGQLDANLQTVQNQEYAPINNNLKRPGRCQPTICAKPRAGFCQQEAGKAIHILTYMLYKTQSMLLSALSRKGQPDSDLHPVQNPEHALVSYKHGRQPRC